MLEQKWPIRFCQRVILEEWWGNNLDRELIENLDDIPYASKFMKNIYLDIYDYSFLAATFPAIQIFIGRGCAARCNYCVYPQVMYGHI